MGDVIVRNTVMVCDGEDAENAGSRGDGGGRVIESNKRVGDKYFNLLRRKGRAPRVKLSEMGRMGKGIQG
jgi:hypothetical protein